MKTSIFLLILIMLFLSPIPFGSAEDWSTHILELGAFTSLLLWIIWRRENLKIGSYGFYIPFGVFLLLCILQIIPLPGFLVGLISPKTLSIWKESESVLSQVGLGSGKALYTVSISPNKSWKNILLILAYFSFFLVVVNTFGKREIRFLLFGVFAITFFESFYGLTQYLTESPNILWAMEENTSTANGTYINRNHFAGFLGMTIPLFIGYALSLGDWEKKGFLRSLVSSDRFSKEILLFSLAGIMLVALIFSKSRAGIFSAFSSLLFFYVLISTKLQGVRQNPGGVKSRAFIVVLVVVLAYALWIGLDPVIERFTRIEGDTVHRAVVWKDTARATLDFPLLGTGLGTYGYVFPAYRKEALEPVVYTHAHNDYLQLALETGFLGFVAIILGIWLFFTFSWNRIKAFPLEESDPFRLFVSVGALSGVFSLLFHSFTDFNLHITANGLYFTLLFGVIVVLLGDKNKIPA